MSPFSTIILAAGRSRRLGQPKAYLQLSGETLIARTTRIASAAGSSHIIAVVGANAGEELVARSRVEPTLRPLTSAELHLVVGKPDGTPIDSLRAGLPCVPRDHHLLVWPVDCPFAEVSTLLALYTMLGNGAFAIVQPRVNGRGGHPILIGSALVAELWDESLTEGLRTLLSRHQRSIRVLPCDDPRLCEDIDTPSDALRLGIALA